MHRVLIASAGVLLVAVTGCSSGTSTSSSPSASGPAGSSPASSAPATAPASGSTLTLKTNRGDIAIEMDPAAAQTTASMVSLSEKGYFDDTVCHRLTTAGIFVLQCGDPTGTGTGGPGYTLPDENLPASAKDNYPAGTVAMANAGPGTTGSQFFIVYKDTTLPPSYTVLGQVTSGLDVVKKVAAAGVEGGGSDGPPKEKVVIESTSVS